MKKWGSDYKIHAFWFLSFVLNYSTSILLRFFKVVLSTKISKMYNVALTPIGTLLYLIKKYSILSLKEIGDIFQMDYAAVSQAAKRFEDVLKTNKRYSSMKNVIIETLKGEVVSNVET